MHFEILVEDLSGKKLIESVMPRILGPLNGPHTWRIISYKGIGKIPKGLTPQSDPERRILLDQLPRLLAGYGRTFPDGACDTVVVVVLDADRHPCRDFLDELNNLLGSVFPQPKVLFRLAIEEIEAWLLGDQDAVKLAYPRARTSAVSNYVQDSICGTWEKLADEVYPGGSVALKKLPYYEIGKAKSEWASNIGSILSIADNKSTSFAKFRDGLKRLTYC